MISVSQTEALPLANGIVRSYTILACGRNRRDVGEGNGAMIPQAIVSQQQWMKNLVTMRSLELSKEFLMRTHHTDGDFSLAMHPFPRL